MKNRSLGIYLLDLRQALKFTLRDVERISSVSNAYICQLEHGKILKTSPDILYKLAKAYGITYEYLMEKVGYIKAGKSSRCGILPFDLTKNEEEELLKYLAFLRYRQKEDFIEFLNGDVEKGE